MALEEAHMRALVHALALAATVTLLAAGCAGRYEGTVAGPGYEPEMVYVSPGVQVIADYDEPVFYSDHLYWRYYGGTWYRSPRYTGGWVVATPPPAVMRIDRPHSYVHYRPRGWIAHRGPAAAPPPPPRQYVGRPGFQPARPPTPPPRFYQSPPARPAPRPHLAPPPAPPHGVSGPRPGFERRGPVPPGR